MHTLATQLAPVLAAEKSKVPFYVAGGVLVAWALIVSLGLGMRRPRFPGNEAGQRLVIAISAVLVLAVVSTAVITAGGSSTAAETHPASTSTSAETPPPSAPAGTTSQPTSSPAAPAPAGAASPAAETSLKLAANPGGLLSFDTKQLSAKAGKVTIAFTNGSPIEHNVAVAQASTVLGTTPTFAGGSKTLSLTLKAGTYTFYCSVPGHRQAGMEGTLKVS